LAFTALFDANALYGATVRSLIVTLAQTDLFRARWTHDIHSEWMNALRQKKPDIDQAKLDNVRDLMIAAVPDSLVTGYEAMVPTLELPDPKDRHVLAAAIKGRADVIVTWNLRDFPAQTLSAYDIHAETPDEFIMHLESLERSTVIRAAAEDRMRYKNPPVPPQDYLDRLKAGQLIRTAEFLSTVKVLLK
jgi:predicted nucleic acid-binding protein